MRAVFLRVNHQHETNNLASNSGFFGCALPAQNCASISPEKREVTNVDHFRTWCEVSHLGSTLQYFVAYGEKINPVSEHRMT